MTNLNKEIKYKPDRTFKKLSRSAKTLYIVVIVLLTVYCLTLIVPFLWLAVNSLQDPGVYLMNMTAGGAKAFALPEKPQFINYVYAFQQLSYPTSRGTDVSFIGMFFNSLWFMLCRTGLNILVCALTAYIMSKYNFRARNFIYAVILFSMTIPIVGGSGSSFKLVWQLGIYNNPLYAILTSLGGTGFNFLVMYGFFKNISWSYAEAVFIDGGNHYTALFKVMLPQAVPVIGTLVILSAIGTWNDYMTPLLYLPDYPTVASGLYLISKSSVNRQGNFPVYYAAIFISIIPVLALFVAFSDVIMNNLSVGGLKG